MTIPDEKIMQLLEDSGVLNDLTHWEVGSPHTFITSLQEIKKLILLVIKEVTTVINSDGDEML